MPEPAPWCLIFSDGTGQRGVRRRTDSVKNTNMFQMFIAAEGKPGLETFYDAGLGAPAEGENSWGRTARNLWSKATGWGITANIADCYEALLIGWKPGMKIGLVRLQPRRLHRPLPRRRAGDMRHRHARRRRPDLSRQGWAGSDATPQDRRRGRRRLQDQGQGRAEGRRRCFRAETPCRSGGAGCRRRVRHGQGARDCRAS